MVLLILFLLSILSLYRKNFIEGGVRKSQIDQTKTTRNRITRGLSFARLPFDKLINRLGWRFPAFRDQIHSTLELFIIFLIATVVLTIMQSVTYEGEVKTALTLSSIDMPFIDAALFNYNLEPTLEGWFTLEFFAWAWMIPGPWKLSRLMIPMHRRVSNFYTKTALK